MPKYRANETLQYFQVKFINYKALCLGKHNLKVVLVAFYFQF